MATEIILPKLGFSVNEMTLTEWLAADGAVIQEGDAILTLESDKSVQEIEAPASGTLRIQAETGVSYPVGTVLGIIE